MFHKFRSQCTKYFYAHNSIIMSSLNSSRLFRFFCDATGFLLKLLKKKKNVMRIILPLKSLYSRLLDLFIISHNINPIRQVTEFKIIIEKKKNIILASFLSVEIL